MEDRFMNDWAVVQRLVEEYKKYGRLIIALDFDGTIHDYHKKGDTYPKVIALIRKAYSLGCKIIVYSCRDKSRYQEIIDYMEKEDIPYDTINEPIVKLHETDGVVGKIFYSIFLDDRAGLRSAYECLEKAITIIEKWRELYE